MDLDNWFLPAAGALAWLTFASFLPRQASWFVLLWISIQGWVQLNLFNDSNATVLIYEFQILGLFLIFVIRALKYPKLYGPPRALLFAIPFFVWTCLLIPYSSSQGGMLLTAIGLRTYLLPLPIVWLGYHAFRTRDELERVATVLSISMGITGVIAALQYARFVTSWGNVIDVPTGFAVAGALRPPGTFSTPGHLGMYVLAMVPLEIGFLALNAPWTRRATYGVGLGGAVLALVVNSQRATVVLLCAALPMLVVLARKVNALKVLAAAVGVAIVGAIVGLFIVQDAFASRILSISNDANYALFIAPIDRMNDAMESPVTGAGLGTASPGVGRVNIATIVSAESFMAALVYQLGIPGAVLFYLYLAALFVAGFKALQKVRRQDIGLLAAAILAYQITILLQSWTYDPLHYPPSRVIFWFWAGVLIALPQLADRPILAGRLKPWTVRQVAGGSHLAGQPSAAALS